MTFDEFGMWVHLGGSYWQRASFDWFTAGALVLAILVFGVMLTDTFHYAHRILFRIQILDEQQPLP